MEDLLTWQDHSYVKLQVSHTFVWRLQTAATTFPMIQKLDIGV